MRVSRETGRGEQSFEEDVIGETFSGTFITTYFAKFAPIPKNIDFTIMTRDRARVTSVKRAN